MSVRVGCPACGGPVVFEVGSSALAVCPHCRSAVARGDRSVEDLGKVAALVETGAALRVGLEGHYDGQKFRLTGRTQLKHPAGGVWDEWYAAFPDGRWGWLSEAQGRYYLLFEQSPRADRPQWNSLTPGRKVKLHGMPTRFTVAETGTATAAGAEGELPYRLVPGQTYRYADLSGPDRAFATLDYGDTPPALYLGKEVTLGELGVAAEVRRETWELREVGGKRLGCPNCGGPLDLKAPDTTERVGCPYCGSLLDATQGDLRLLNAPSQPPFELQIPLGTTGTFGADERTVIGAIRRAVVAGGTEYPWTEYLLYHPRDEFEWLVCSDGHWSRVKGVPAGEVEEGKVLATFRGRTYRKFQAGTAIVRGVLGECYWKVAVGERAETLDAIRPPEMLSKEEGGAGDAREVNWSLGTYLRPAEVRAAFDLKDPLPAPVGIAPNQPFPYQPVYRYAALFVGALCLLGLFALVFLRTRTVAEQTFTLRPPAPPTPTAPGVAAPPAPAEKAQEFFTDQFELRPRRNVRVTLSCPELTGWLAADVDLVRQADGSTESVFIPLTRYSGVEDGEAWTEGDTEGRKYLSAQPAGEYSLRLEVERENPQATLPLTVKVEEGAAHAGPWLLALLALVLVPIGVGIYHLAFVLKRWENADFHMAGDGTAGTGGGDDSGGDDGGSDD
ncbi:MAG: DUF4178 domain-containing protein [Gemmataceae bacterium]|nr:DUF4178 domain-containing protein [Gemmataceae bacterium]